MQDETKFILDNVFLLLDINLCLQTSLQINILAPPVIVAPRLPAAAHAARAGRPAAPLHRGRGRGGDDALCKYADVDISGDIFCCQSQTLYIILFLQTFHVDTENVGISCGKVLRVVCRYCTVISRVGGLAVDVARAPAHPVVGVAGGLARAVGEPAESRYLDGGGIVPSNLVLEKVPSEGS